MLLCVATPAVESSVEDLGLDPARPGTLWDARQAV